MEELQQVEGIRSVERIVCPTGLEFKVITTVDVDKFEQWKEDEFDPEIYFLEFLESIPGITDIETQTYTKQIMDLNATYDMDDDDFDV
mmetsp:Transcript_31843/g.45280  ORF Transcript_31843/g.45280 Transcript_31843/m.45280 type:complete len:88 (+) Transcript_31843:455-718(+)|eukprot:CAMPEP_0202450350 /NCGR_PEP_ID=MMETSP1360-20130828/8968_1 /ASSEMBLY_ACC=CAM_ASM_000848 /TAXON_ID=515479 /ORGANISM="Licmophora paradoxa, Strain CCMP2313" /LENGTH=87 /DNA_ID=CAMNT_0049068577 /DNA_START=441 /DNA_END=704 /DNA_ORIENTATION=+